MENKYLDPVINTAPVEAFGAKKAQWELASVDGKSFFFTDVNQPGTNINSFTVTHLPHGYGVLTGDLGSLLWCRHPSATSLFPHAGTQIDYFEEKVLRAEYPKEGIRYFDLEEASKEAAEVYAHLADDESQEYYDEFVKRLEALACLGEHLQEQGFYDVLSKVDGDWWEMDWTTYRPKFVSKYRMLVVAHEAIKEYYQRVEEDTMFEHVGGKDFCPSPDCCPDQTTKRVEARGEE